MFHKYPYTDFHEMNADSLISKIHCISEKVKQLFKKTNDNATNILKINNKINEMESGAGLLGVMQYNADITGTTGNDASFTYTIDLPEHIIANIARLDDQYIIVESYIMSVNSIGYISVQGVNRTDNTVTVSGRYRLLNGTTDTLRFVIIVTSRAR